MEQIKTPREAWQPGWEEQDSRTPASTATAMRLRVPIPFPNTAA